MKSANTDIFDVDLEQFETAVIAASHQTPMLVDFWADWCAPCIVLAPTLERVMEHWRGKIKLAKLEVDEGDNMKLAGHYRVRGFPTVILFINGEEKARFTSAKPKHWIDEFLVGHLCQTNFAQGNNGK
jgi:putative thioredoxin